MSRLTFISIIAIITGAALAFVSPAGSKELGKGCLFVEDAIEKINAAGWKPIPVDAEKSKAIILAIQKNVPDESADFKVGMPVVVALAPAPGRLMVFSIDDYQTCRYVHIVGPDAYAIFKLISAQGPSKIKPAGLAI